mmetsp:Transcript_13569/g.22813  ORF Transcript_13569/g.22813 Transcript_13569/m.22813 type:complete len:236 (+) Transcript_13569:655-1362(+)
MRLRIRRGMRLRWLVMSLRLDMMPPETSSKTVASTRSTKRKARTPNNPNVPVDPSSSSHSMNVPTSWPNSPESNSLKWVLFLENVGVPFPMRTSKSMKIRLKKINSDSIKKWRCTLPTRLPSLRRMSLINVPTISMLPRMRILMRSIIIPSMLIIWTQHSSNMHRLSNSIMILMCMVVILMLSMRTIISSSIIMPRLYLLLEMKSDTSQGQLPMQRRGFSITYETKRVWPDRSMN